MAQFTENIGALIEYNRKSYYSFESHCEMHKLQMRRRRVERATDLLMKGSD